MSAHVNNETRFAPVPEALLYDATISAEAVRVYATLRRHGDDPTNCYPSHRRIADLIGKSARSVPAWIRELEAAGWIERTPRVTVAGDADSNSYRVFLIPHERAGERGVCVDERIPVRATQRGGSTPHSAPKESNGTTATRNEESLFANPAPEPPPPSPVESVFDTWRLAAGKTAATKLDPKRKRVIQNALAAYPLDDVLAAVQGWKNSPWHCGKNPDGKTWNEITRLLSDADHIERFRDLWLHPPRANGTSSGPRYDGSNWTEEQSTGPVRARVITDTVNV